MGERVDYEAVALAAALCVSVGVSMFDGEWITSTRFPRALLVALACVARLAYLDREGQS